MIKSVPYFAKPVGVRDWDMVNTEVPAAPAPVENGGEVWKIPVEVDILCIGPSVGPAIQQVALKD